VTVFAFECFADRDVFEFLKGDRRLPIRPEHCGDQGRVVHAVLVKRDAHIGLVDEDPLSSHHRRRDDTQVVHTTDSLVVRRQGDRYLIVVKPELEECFRRSISLVKLESRLRTRPQEMRALLGIPQTAKHRLFQEELAMLYRESKARNVNTFVTDLEQAVRNALEAHC
jgi:hypothetical protein